MQIITNVMALNAQRNLDVTSHRMAKALEQLSSGLRINRAADDAAGLAISEKMRAQIRGMRQGLRNAQDGISMIQTAEGALSETHAILQRMRELCTQAGSTTLSASDRVAIAEELVTLKAEISNIASRTRFNGLDLLTGALSVQAGAGTTLVDFIDTGDDDTVTVSIDLAGAVAGATYNLTAAGTTATLAYDDGSGVIVTQDVTFAALSGDGDSQVLNFDALGVKVGLTAVQGPATGDGNISTADIVTGLNGTAIVTTGDGNATFRVGAEVTDNVTVAFADLRATNLGDVAGGASIDDLITGNDAVSTVGKADTLIASVDIAFAQVSTQRAKLGAAQNQMQTAVNSLGVAVENLSASESRIRDADIAAVSSDLVAQQIMQQAGVSVLAHANTAPQAVLQLLRG